MPSSTNQILDSILDSVKKSVGIGPDYEAFDPDIIMHINSVLSTLHSLGVGPDTGFAIEDSMTEWVEFIGEDPRLNMVKSYIYLKVRLLFDPPQTSFTTNKLDEMAKEYEWRLNVASEGGSQNGS